MSEIIPIIYIVDDDSSVRASLSLLIESAGYKVICFNSADEFLKFDIEPSTHGCLILDVKMPGLSGLDLQKKINAIGYEIPIIFITGHGDIPMSVQAMKDGADDFLSKPFDDDELLDSINEALLRNIESFEKKLNHDQIEQKTENLSSRENEVLRHLIAGLLNKQIAYKLNITERTVKAHRKQIMDKMGIKSIAELVRMTEKIGIIPID